MNVLVIGSGGREHALAWKISKSPLLRRLYCAPGNPGVQGIAECVPIAASDIPALVAFASENEIDLVVVGPEDPLANGLVDALIEAGIPAFGPKAAAARLEASKAFAKHIMKKYGIPSAAYEEFTDAEAALAYVRAQGAPIVIKADGLAAGKGVTVARSVDEAEAAIRAAMVDGIFGDAGNRVVVEECLFGEEASILAFCDGTTVRPMLVSQDHKPVYDDDAGPNTGGMGAYAPAPVVNAAMLDEITRTILEPCVAGMAQEGCPYTGVLYAGLMIGEHGPKVIEFNCRFGDPETQVVLPLMESDILPVLMACCEGRLAETPIQWSTGACVTVVMASGGYPGAYTKGIEIAGIDDAEANAGVFVFHAGTAFKDGALVTQGGRVLNVTASAADIPAAIDKAYAGVRRIHFEGAHSRTDIGRKALRRLGLA